MIEKSTVLYRKVVTSDFNARGDFPVSVFVTLEVNCHAVWVVKDDDQTVVKVFSVHARDKAIECGVNYGAMSVAALMAVEIEGLNLYRHGNGPALENGSEGVESSNA